SDRVHENGSRPRGTYPDESALHLSREVDWRGRMRTVARSSVFTMTLVVAVMSSCGARDKSIQTRTSATQLERGKAAYGLRDYARALELLQPLADKGDTAAQTRVGLMYLSGAGVQRDPAHAAALLQKAAEQGNGSAQACLGYMCRDGMGVT